MSDYLSSVIGRKRQEVETMQAPEDVPISQRSFIHALRCHGEGGRRPSLIAEIKPTSPSAGMMIERTRIPSVVDEYNSFAQAISVLCDVEDFGGGYDLLADVRGMTMLPILAKEFIIDARQIRMARSCGADAVLLIAQALSADQIQILSTKIVQLGMAVLYEVHDEEDCRRIPDLSPEQMVIGINNRNLRTLTVDLETTERMAPAIRASHPEHLLFSLSGIGHRADAERLMEHVDGFLIGTALLWST